jgi:hypothetical protein
MLVMRYGKRLCVGAGSALRGLLFWLTIITIEKEHLDIGSAAKIAGSKSITF